MTSDRPGKSARNRLFVEGADDFHVVCALVRKAGVEWTSKNPRIPYAPETSGDADAIDKAVVAVKSRAHPSVGLVVDADADAIARWRRVVDAFADVAELPQAYPTNGAVVRTAEGQLGVWMMPHGGRAGTVESLVVSLVPASSSKLRDHAIASTDLARGVGGAFADKDREKAWLRAWLAWQKAPGAPYGRAIDAGFLAPSSTETGELVGWFRSVFDL